MQKYLESAKISSLCEKMIRRGKRIPSVFDEQRYKSIGLSGNIFFRIFFVVLLLVFVRFLNLTFVWNMTKLELKKSQLLSAENFSFLGLTGFKSAKNKFADDAYFKHKKIIIASYYDLFHPAVFLVYNKGGESGVTCW